jgi:predicted nuclease of restriction endonuclease-like (RecB) superfamily
MVKKKTNIVTKKTPVKVVAQEYLQTLADLKKQIQESQIKAAFAANKELIKLYWSIGKTIVEQQEKNGWGSKVIEKLAEDLQKLFPGVAGFSRANIFRMRAFYEAYGIVAQSARQLEELPIFNIPWFHNVILLQKIKDTKERLWYAQKAIDNGWSRNTLETWIKSNLYKREGKAVTNFQLTLPKPHSDMAQQSLKDPYVFDFLTLHDEHVEHDIEQGLIDNIQKLLLELGKGFALVGRQVHVEVSDHDYYIDLLFYHLQLRCYVVVELKARPFDPRDAGQLNFYLSIVDDQFRHADDKPTIGILLCKTKDDLVAEYALRGINRPIGVAGYETEIVKKLPKELKSSLPTIEEIEAEFEKQEMLAEVKKPKKVAVRKKPEQKVTRKKSV